MQTPVPPKMPAPDAVARWLAGESPSDEAALVRAWVEAKEARRQTAHGLKTLGDTEQYLAQYPDVDVDGMWSRLERKLAREDGVTPQPHRVRDEDAPKQFVKIGAEAPMRPERMRGTTKHTMRTMSSEHGWRETAALGTQTLRRWGWSIGFALTAFAAVMLGRMGQRGLGARHTYTTHTGQQATLALVDGTRVTLAPQSTIRLTQFGGQLRTVELDGEAYFEVAHASGAPFIVRSGSVITRVLGTAFLVRHYLGEMHVRVAVADGKVNVTGLVLPTPGLLLVAGRVGDISDSTVHVSTVEDVSAETDWMRGKLIFRDAPVTEVLATLSRWYGFHFRYADSTIAQQDITAGLSTQSAAAALSTLEQVLGVSLAVRGDTVTFTSNAAHSVHGSSRKRSYDVWTPTSEVGR